VAIASTDEAPAVRYAELIARSARVAGGLAALGVGQGDVIALWLPNVAEYVVLLLAAERLGACVAGLNTRYRSEELRSILQTSRARTLIMMPAFHDVEFAAILRDVRGDLPDLQIVITVGAAASDVPDAVAYEALARSAPLDRAARTGAHDALAAFTTSGTTSAPKLATHDAASLARHARNDAAAFEMHAGDVNLCVLPFCGVFGLCAMAATLAAGATVLAMPVFDGAEAARAIARHDVTHLFGTDPMLAAILDGTGDPSTLRSLRRGGFADFGGRLATLLERWERETGVRFGGLYGSSECFALMTSWPVNLPAAERARVGGVLVDVEMAVRAVDPETGSICADGAPGELQFRGYNVTSGYLGNSDATARAFTADGWFRSGDLGTTLDARTFLFATRMGDSLRLRGYLVDPREIEEFLERHPSVAKAQVVGADGPDGQVPVAFVQSCEGATIVGAELSSFARERIAAYKVPHAFVAVDAFPTTPSANGEKVRKTELRKRAQAFLKAQR
jgi:fatty-acyl-CoA synthase